MWHRNAACIVIGLLASAVNAAEPAATPKASAGSTTPSAASVPGDYKLQPGDVLNISVWKEQDLTREVLIRPDGSFSFPLGGDMQAVGRTAEQVRQDLVTRLSAYMPEPEVSVAVIKVTGNRVFVIGKVNKPGEFILQGPVNVMQALSMAGGATTFANVDDIKILRHQGGKQIAIPFDYGDVEDGDDLEQNIQLQNGDTVVVP